jgi:hypothetical protein
VSVPTGVCRKSSSAGMFFSWSSLGDHQLDAVARGEATRIGDQPT